MKGLRAIVAAAMLAGVCVAWADGGYFPEESVDVEPAIPSQRAFLAHRNGQETLIVESAIDAPAGEYAWVIPLPNVPTEVKPSTTGALKTLEALLPPSVDRERRQVDNYLLIFAAGAALLALSAPHRLAGKKYRASRLAVETAFLGFVCMLGSILLPKYGQIRSDWMTDTATGYAEAEKSAESRGGVFEHASGDVGSYRYSVVSAQGVVDLLDWLKANKYALPDKAKPAVEAYVKKGWKFFAARLRHDGGDARPHPIKLVFPCDKPVYPMALTSAIGGDVLLDLYVVGNGQANVPGMKAWRADKLTQTDRNPVVQFNSYERLPGWRPVSHPEAASAFWDGAVITRLRGEFAARSVTDDLEPAFEPLRAPYRAWLVSTALAKDVAWLWGLIAACVLLVPLGAVAIEWKATPGPMWAAVGIACVVGLGVGFGRYRSLDRHDEAFPFAMHYGGPGIPNMDGVAAQAKRVLDREPGTPVEAALRRSLPGPQEDVPSGHTVEKTPGGFRVTVYDEYGAAKALTIAAKDMAPAPESPMKPVKGAR